MLNKHPPLNDNPLDKRLCQKQQGFTLIELLIAMALSAVIIALSYQAITQATQIQNMTSAKAEQLKKLQRTFWWLEKDVSQIVPRSIKSEYDSVLPAFELITDSTQTSTLELTRIAKGQSPYATAGLLRVGYLLQNNTLYRLIWPVVDRSPDTQPNKIPILRNIKGFKIQVLDNKLQWHTDWPEIEQPKNALPQMVEVTLTLGQGNTITRLFPAIDNLDQSQEQP